MTNYLKSVYRLLAATKDIETMSKLRKAAMRAQLTKLLKDNKVKKYPEIEQALRDLQAEIGPAVTKAKAKVTVDDIEKEFFDKFSGYDTGQRGAFKAKVTRRRRIAEKAGDANTVKRLIKIEQEIVKLQDNEMMTSIRAMIKSRNPKGK